MLLTKTQDGAASAARSRIRRIAGTRVPTMDRRAFLKRSGLVAGAGAFASQLSFNVINEIPQQRGIARCGLHGAVALAVE